MRIWITGDNKAQWDLIVIELWADSCSQRNSDGKEKPEENTYACARTMQMRIIQLIYRNHIK